MKKLLIFVLGLILILPNNGCRILKHKTKESSLTETNIKNDISVSKKKVDSLAALKKYQYDKTSTIVNEEINYKIPNDNQAFELTANFKVDPTMDKNGDTAFKLVDVKNNNVSITVYQNKKTNEFMAKVKTESGTKNMSFSEMQIKRSTVTKNDITDTSKSVVNIVKEAGDSLDRSKIKELEKVNKVDLNKDIKPTFWSWGIVVLILSSVILIVVIIYKRNHIFSWLKSLI